jgi:hypothetical protein
MPAPLLAAALPYAASLGAATARFAPRMFTPSKAGLGAALYGVSPDTPLSFIPYGKPEAYAPNLPRITPEQMRIAEEYLLAKKDPMNKGEKILIKGK